MLFGMLHAVTLLPLPTDLMLFLALHVGGKKFRFLSAVAACAERRKETKYSLLDSALPVAIETLECFSSKTYAFLKELGKRITCLSGDQHAPSYYLLQHLSVAIQRGNSASIIGSLSNSSSIHFYSYYRFKCSLLLYCTLDYYLSTCLIFCLFLSFFSCPYLGVNYIIIS